MKVHYLAGTVFELLGNFMPNRVVDITLFSRSNCIIDRRVLKEIVLDIFWHCTTGFSGQKAKHTFFLIT